MKKARLAIISALVVLAAALIVVLAANGYLGFLTETGPAGQVPSELYGTESPGATHSAEPDYYTLCYQNPMQYGKEGSDPTLLVVQSGGRFGYNKTFSGITLQDGGLLGYADAEGRIVIPPQYEDARPFYEGLAAVKKDGKYGYIDEAGKTVLPFGYVEALDFHNGWAFVGLRWVLEDPYSYYPRCIVIDRNGRSLRGSVACQSIGDYSDGFISINGGERYFDEDHRDLGLRPEYAEIGLGYGFHEGLTVYSHNDLYGYMDKSGNLAIEARFTKAGGFSGGLASVQVILGDYGYIDKTGELVIRAEFLNAYGFGEGMALVQLEESQYAVIDQGGNIKSRVSMRIDRAGSFSDGLCPVGRRKESPDSSVPYGTEEWGFIDSTGKLVIAFGYDRVTPFTNGIAQVMVDGKIGYIDKTGKYIWEPK
jgi:hypothetical protein